MIAKFFRGAVLKKFKKRNNTQQLVRAVRLFSVTNIIYYDKDTSQRQLHPVKSWIPWETSCSYKTCVDWKQLITLERLLSSLLKHKCPGAFVLDAVTARHHCFVYFLSPSKHHDIIRLLSNVTSCFIQCC